MSLTPPPRPPTSANGRAAAPGTNGRRLWLTSDQDEGDDNFDALTDLFLGEVARPRRDNPEKPSAATAAPMLRLVSADTTEETPAEPPVAPEARPLQPPFVECLIVGNLPVLASAWASQYVREVARAAGRTVAFLRVQAGYVTIELVGDEAASDRRPSTDIEAALQAAAAVTNRWVVRVDPSEEPAIAARAGVRLVTLLTGADEAARVNAYASLKTIAEKTSTSESAPIVRVAVMSAPEATADAAGKKLVDTVRQFLGRDVQHAVCSAKIRASRAAEIVFNGRVELTTAMVIERLEHVLGSPIDLAIELPAPRPVAAQPVVVPAEPAARFESKADPEVVYAPEVEPTPAILPAPTVAPAPRRVDDVALWSATATTTKPQLPTEPDHALSLAKFIEGASGLPLTCPYAAGVQIALDAAGRLHLLARSAGAHDDERTLSELMVASAWADAHASLLNAAVPGYKPGAGQSLMHVFTATPKRSRRLLETSIRVHALGMAGAEWFSIELN